MSPQMIGELVNATWQTIIMVFFSCFIAVLIGLPLGILLYITGKQQLLEKPGLNRFLSIIVNIGRSIPFIILMVAVIPITRFIVGTSIGTIAAIVPLSLAAVPFVARLIEGALAEVPKGLIEASQAMGASLWQIVSRVYVAEALPAIVRGITLTLVTLVGYSAMAGAIGANGLGDLAIRYGYQRFEVGVMIVTIVILVLLVQLFQYIGDYIAMRLAHYK